MRGEVISRWWIKRLEGRQDEGRLPAVLYMAVGDVMVAKQ